jgi:hypothetical protein
VASDNPVGPVKESVYVIQSGSLIIETYIQYCTEESIVTRIPD